MTEKRAASHQRMARGDVCLLIMEETLFAHFLSHFQQVDKAHMLGGVETGGYPPPEVVERWSDRHWGR